MRRPLLFVFLFLFATTSAFATIHYVDNTGTVPGAYTSPQAAHDAATAGDTVYVYGSSTCTIPLR